MEFSNDYKSGQPVVYLTMNEKGETQNVFATLGMAIDNIAFQAKRIDEKNLESLTLSKIVWHGSGVNEHKQYSLEIKKCFICTDNSLDYMVHPMTINL